MRLLLPFRADGIKADTSGIPPEQVARAADGHECRDGRRTWLIPEFCAFLTAFIIGMFLAGSPLVVCLAGKPENCDRARVVYLVRGVAERHGIDPDDFVHMAKIESALNPRAYHPISKAAGLFQVIPSTARQYGLTTAFDPSANAEAAAALWRDNERALRRALKREPTAGELYLAHQQGAGGAIRLLTQPGKLAVQVVGYRAVTLNGGYVTMTAREFAQKWTSRFDRS